MRIDGLKYWARIISVVTLMLLSQKSIMQAQAPQLVAELATGIRTYRIAWSPDGELIAVANDNGALILDQNLAVLTNLQGHDSNITASVAWHPNGSQLATGGGDNTVRIWNRDITTNSFAFNRILETEVEATPVLAWSPDGQKLASLSMAPILNGLAAYLNIWNTTGSWPSEPKPEYIYTDPLFTLTWSFDSQFLALAGRSLCFPVTSQTCSEASEEQGVFVIDTDIGAITNIIQRFPFPGSIAWSPIDSRLASTSFSEVEILDGFTGVFLQGLPHAGERLAWSSDGTKVAGSVGDAVRILDVNLGEITQSIPFAEAWSIQWSPDGSKLAIADLDGLIQIWEVGTLVGTSNTECGANHTGE